MIRGDFMMAIRAVELPEVEALMPAGVLELDELDALVAEIEMRRKFDEDPTDDDVEDDTLLDDDDDDDDDDDPFSEDDDFDDDEDEADEEELDVDEDDESA